MFFMIPGTTDWMTLLAFWRNPQVDLQEVFRWAKYSENGGARRQNCLQHSHSIVLMGIFIAQQLREYLRVVDWEMVLTALTVHDLAEACSSAISTTLTSPRRAMLMSGSRSPSPRTGFRTRFGSASARLSCSSSVWMRTSSRPFRRRPRRS